MRRRIAQFRWKQGSVGTFNIEETKDTLGFPYNKSRYAIDAEVWHLMHWRNHLHEKGVKNLKNIKRDIILDYKLRTAEIELEESEYCQGVAKKHGYKPVDMALLKTNIEAREQDVRDKNERLAKQGTGLTALFNQIDRRARKLYIHMSCLKTAAMKDLRLHASVNEIGDELLSTKQLSPASISSLSNLLASQPGGKTSEQIADILRLAFGNRR